MNTKQSYIVLNDVILFVLSREPLIDASLDEALFNLINMEEEKDYKNNLAYRFIERYNPRWTTYKPYSVASNIVEKVYNEGRGALALIGFREDIKTIIINTVLIKPKDRSKLDEFIVDNNLTDWIIVNKSYGYPDWYNHNFMVL